jgi:RND superfamily putative drug exporter
VITDRLPLLEVVTLAVGRAGGGAYLRSAVAPLVTLATVAICYLLSVRLVAVVGSAVGISVPAEVEPIVVALLFGVVTDYGLFYMSRFRRRLAEGDPPVEASRRTIVDLTPDRAGLRPCGRRGLRRARRRRAGVPAGVRAGAWRWRSSSRWPSP